MSAVSLFKALCDPHRSPRVICWQKACGSLPRSFCTSARACIICNEPPKVANPNVAALFDRARVVLFNPPAGEVHRFAGTWLEGKQPGNRDVWEFVGANLHRVSRFSVRLYLDAIGEKLDGRNWKEWLNRKMEGVDAAGNVLDKSALYMSIIGEIAGDPKVDAGQRVIVWKQRTGLGRSFYFRNYAEWRCQNGAAKVGGLVDSQGIPVESP